MGKKADRQRMREERARAREEEERRAGKRPGPRPRTVSSALRALLGMVALVGPR